MRGPGRGHSVCKGQEAGTFSEVNEFYWLVLVMLWEYTCTPCAVSAEKCPVLSLPHSCGRPFQVHPLGSSSNRKTIHSPPDHTHSPCHPALTTDWLTCKWPTTDHTHVKCTMWWVSACLHSPHVSIPPKSVSCALEIPSSAPHPTPRVWRQLLLFSFPQQISFHFLKFYINKIIYCVFLLIWFP